MQRAMLHLAPQAALRPAMQCASRPRLAVMAAAAPGSTSSSSSSSGDKLEPWQVSRLQQALLAGRRQVKVEKLCKELGLPRGTVLQWLRDAPQPDPAQQSLLEARAAAEAAARERAEVLRVAKQQGGGGGSGPGTNSSSSGSAAPRGGKQGPAGGGRGSDGAPAWRSYPKKKALGRQAEATLEMIFNRTQWPSDDTIASLWDLHRLPREKVVEWFKKRRMQEQQQLRGGGGGGGGAKPRGSRGGNEWDAWDPQDDLP
ncbi:hypothetical protein ABPG75_001813 [Micractinium tetrahymenae]